MHSSAYIENYNLFLTDMGIEKKANLRDIFRRIIRKKSKGVINTPIPPSTGKAEQSARVFEEAFKKNKGVLYPTTLKGKALIGTGLGIGGLGLGTMLNKENKPQESIRSPLDTYYTYNNGLNSYYGP